MLIDLNKTVTRTGVWVNYLTDQKGPGGLGASSNGSLTYQLAAAGNKTIVIATSNKNSVLPVGYEFKFKVFVDDKLQGEATENKPFNIVVPTATSKLRIAWEGDYYVAGKFDANLLITSINLTDANEVAASMPLALLGAAAALWFFVFRK